MDLVEVKGLVPRALVSKFYSYLAILNDPNYKDSRPNLERSPSNVTSRSSVASSVTLVHNDSGSLTAKEKKFYNYRREMIRKDLIPFEDPATSRAKAIAKFKPEPAPTPPTDPPPVVSPPPEPVPVPSPAPSVQRLPPTKINYGNRTTYDMDGKIDTFKMFYLNAYEEEYNADKIRPMINNLIEYYTKEAKTTTRQISTDQQLMPAVISNWLMLNEQKNFLEIEKYMYHTVHDKAVPIGADPILLNAFLGMCMIDNGRDQLMISEDTVNMLVTEITRYFSTHLDAQTD